MIYSIEFLEQQLEGALKGRSEEQYVKEGAAKIVKLLQASPNFWKVLGPYYPAIANILRKYQPQYKQVDEWGDSPDYLLRYKHGSDALNLVAALTYLNRDGAYLSHPDQPHSIETFDGPALFMPGIGLIEG